VSNIIINVLNGVPKAELRQSFSTCVYCMLLRFASTIITLAKANQGNYFENANACSKYKLKTTVATQLKTTIESELTRST